jgi:hypothetical protein
LTHTSVLCNLLLMVDGCMSGSIYPHMKIMDRDCSRAVARGLVIGLPLLHIRHHVDG